MIVLLSVIFLSFIGLGLPDTIIGSIWPTIQKDTLSYVYGAGVITLIIQCGTVISSLYSSKLVYKYSTRIVTFFSIILTSIALILFSLSYNFIFLIIASVPLGIGAGSVDAALNGYAAKYFSSNVMNFLHGFWGIGAFAGPFIMSMFIKYEISWRIGYILISFILIIIAIFVFISKKYWIKEESMQVQNEYVTNIKALTLPLVKPALLSFSFFSYIELTTGLWISSFLVFCFNLSSSYAAFITALYYGSITLGRLITGVFSHKFQNHILIRTGEIIVILGCILMASNSLHIVITGILLIGLGSSPIYPAMLHSTPKIFGEKATLTITGLQMAVTYTGGATAPLIFGLMADKFSFSILPFFILFGALIIFILSEYLNYKIKVNKII